MPWGRGCPLPAEGGRPHSQTVSFSFTYFARLLDLHALLLDCPLSPLCRRGSQGHGFPGHWSERRSFVFLSPKYYLWGLAISGLLGIRSRSHRPRERVWFKLLLLLSHFSRVRLFATPWTAAHQAPPSVGFSRQGYWSGGIKSAGKGNFPSDPPQPPWKLHLLGWSVQHS